MTMDKLLINDLLMYNIPGEPRTEDAATEASIDPQQPDLTGTPDPTMYKTHRVVIGVENVGGKEYGNATGL